LLLLLLQKKKKKKEMLNWFWFGMWERRRDSRIRQGITKRVSFPWSCWPWQEEVANWKVD
jgi:hypothetical protein